jgi:hypothetical protein
MSPGGMLRVMIAREAGERPALHAAVVGLLALASGMLWSGEGPAAVPPPLALLAGTFSQGLVAAAAILLLLRILARVPEDNASGWLVPLIAAGCPRWLYPAAMAAGIVIVMTAAIAVAVVGFGIGRLLAGGSVNFVSAVVRPVLLTPLMLAPVAVAGLLAGTLGGTNSRTAGVIAAALFIPVLAIRFYAERYGTLPDSVLRTAFIHLPPVTDGTVLQMALPRLAYVCVAGTLLLLLSDRLTGRVR